MEIRVHSRLFQARYKGCTNALCILSRSYGHEEFKNGNSLSVQEAHQAVQAIQSLRPVHRRIVQSMEIRIHSRLFLARYKGCTNAWCILSRSYGHEELKMETLCRCKRRTKLYGPANVSVPCSAVQCHQWKFAYIRHSSKPGTKVALMQGSYNQEAMHMKSL